MANGIIRIENKPEIIPRGIIKTTVKIIDSSKNTSFIGMLKIYNPAENSLNKTITPNAIKRIENISIVYSLHINCHRVLKEHREKQILIINSQRTLLTPRLIY